MAVPVDSNISVTLSEPMDWTTVMLLLDGSQITWTRSGNSISYDPSDDLLYGRTYHVGIVGRDLAGNELLEGSWSFSTDNNCTVKLLVTDEDGGPLSGAVLYFYSGDNFQTGSDGWAEFRTMAGDYAVTVRKEGYKDRIVTITLEPGILNTLGTILLEKGADGEDDDGDEITEEGGGSGLILIILVSVALTAGLAFTIILFIKKRKIAETDGYAKPREDIFDRADELRNQAALKEIDISAIESEFRTARYLKQLGNDEEAEEGMRHYIAILNEYLAQRK
jgi:hypothetical protein